MAFFKRRTKEDVVEKKSFSFGNKTKSGKNAKSGTVVTYKDGTKQTLLTPSGKGAKYALEQKSGVRHTNDLEIKIDPNTGSPSKLSREQAAYRGGYLDALKDSAKVYKAKKNKRKNS